MRFKQSYLSHGDCENVELNAIFFHSFDLVTVYPGHYISIVNLIALSTMKLSNPSNF